MELTRAQEVTPRKATNGPSAGDGKKEQERRALVNTGEIPMLIPSPTSNEEQGAREGAKTIKAPILLCVTHSTLTIGR